MQKHFETLLEAMLLNPGQRLSNLPILTDQESKRVLIDWNDTTTEYPKNRCVHELFEGQVGQTPDAIALEFEGKQFTYRALNARANQLAHYLRKRGVGPEVLVGICAERSLEMVIGLLGILKAGGVYVPLDPSYPEKRLAFILGDTRAPVLVTQQKLIKELPGLSPASLCLDTDWKQIAGESTANLKVRVQPENLAYVIYTSGSTGMPKGVSISHHNVVRLLGSTQSWFHFDHRDVWTLFHSYAFDFSVWEIWGPLLSGGQLVVVPFWVTRSPEAFCELLCESQVTVLNQTPSAFRQLIERVRQSPGILKPARLRTIILGGEALDFKSLTPWFEQHGVESPQVVNMYGITETTVHVTYRPVVRSDMSAASGSLIGRPIPDLNVYILDHQLQPVPVGVAGQICVAGEGLGRGYLNRPDMTAEKYVPNPFSDQPGGRLYKSGDKGRYLPNGDIEYLGRIDHQLKIRGFRIEPGEIEAALEEHPAVRQALVVIREDRSGETHLVAYIVPKQEQTCAINELRSHLRQKLPDYMVPSAFMVLGRLPMTPNGKLDRKALPPPNWGRLESEASYLAPITPVEQLMADIWGEVLRIEHVGVHDNFFDLGGHSLLAMKLSSKLSAATKRHISVRSLFLYPSIAVLADALQSFPPLDGGSRIRNLNQKHADPLQVSVEPSPLQPSSPHLKIERRSLLSLLGTGKIAPVDSAALGYLSDSVLSGTDVTREEVIHDWHEGLPTLSAVMETSLGRIGIITLPRFRSELYDDITGLLGLIVEALELARQVGARVVSMAGLIPSATEYGMAVARTIAGREDLPKITTGHATTAATVVLAIKRILMESARGLGQERVGFLGLGSIGKTVLRLMLRSLPHPAEITLCDLYSKLDSLEGIRKELVNELDFRGPVKVFGATPGLPKGFYDSTLIVGATNVPEVLDLGLVGEGTLIVDDSGPHCFKAEDAMRRFLDREDILFSEGGTLHSPDPMTQIRYLPQQAELRAGHFYRKIVANFNPFQITGCVFSSLLSSRYDELKPTVGLANDRESLLHYRKLVSLGFQAAELHCEGSVLSPTNIRNFLRRFDGNFREQQRSDGKTASLLSLPKGGINPD
jgi:amino acid adenylation domain-containing protein